MIIYAEGGTSNGTHIMKFKRGAFVSNLAIQPYVQKYRSFLTCPVYDTPSFLDYNVLLCLAPFASFTVYKMPPFIPNDYMYEHHASKGTEKWEIYAECLREAMAEAGQMPTSDMPFRKKVEYETYFVKTPGGM